MLAFCGAEKEPACMTDWIVGDNCSGALFQQQENGKCVILVPLSFIGRRINCYS